MKTLMLCMLYLTINAHAEEPKVRLTTVVTNDEKETLLADSIGKTLYVFDLDRGNTNPTCSGDCAEVWPPFVLSEIEVTGLVAPLGSIKRANGKSQLTYQGRPVYTYAFDRLTGDDKGDGIGSVWHYIKL